MVAGREIRRNGRSEPVNEPYATIRADLIGSAMYRALSGTGPIDMSHAVTRVGRRCRPVIVVETAGRYLLTLRVAPTLAGVRKGLGRLFGEIGLPGDRSGNGAPFGSAGGGRACRSACCTWALMPVPFRRPRLRTMAVMNMYREWQAATAQG